MMNSDNNGTENIISSDNVQQRNKKLLGFRSNKIWKKILSIAYLVVCALVAFTVIFEGKYPNITVNDFIVDKVFSLVMLIMLLSPYIFLSNFAFREKLPLFKKHSIGKSILGMLIVFIVLCIIIGVINSFHSQEYLDDMKNHAYVEVEKIDASCEEDGEIHYHCEYCGKDYIETIDAFGHKMVENSRIEATETKEGQIISKCEVCGKEEVTKINKLAPQTQNNESSIGETINNNTEGSAGATENDTEESEDKKESYFTSEDKVNENVKDIDLSIVSVLIEKGYTVEHATAIDEILHTLGIESIEVYFMSGEAESGLNAVSCYPNGDKSDNKRFYFTTEDGVMFYAGFLNDDLYDTEQGGFIKKYSDVHIPEKEVDWDTFYKLQELAEKEVKKYLNYPSTADFGLFDWAVGRSDDNYKIIGKVQAKNGFGVKQDIHFSVWFTKGTSGFVVEGVALNGQRVK